MNQRTFANVAYEVRGGAAWITIERPDKLNALDRRTVEEIGAAATCAGAAPEVRVIVLTGAGEKAFAAGADIQELALLDAAAAQELALFLQGSLMRLERSPKPVIAAVNGFALGGGLELALACHLRIAAETARFAQPEVNLGLIPGAGGTQRLQRVVGRGRALELILGGEMIDAAEALRIGLVNRVVPLAALEDTVATLATTLGSRSGAAQMRALSAVLDGGECSLEEGLRFEAALFGLCFSTHDMREGTRAFIEKRKPAFRHL